MTHIDRLRRDLAARVGAGVGVVLPPLPVVLPLLLAVLAGLSGCGQPAPAPPTATVRVGSVERTASAVGALSGVTSGGPGGVAVVPFEESGAAAVQPGQSVRLTFDAIPGLEQAGSVLAVAPQPVNISGVTNYYVTIVLTEGDPRLRAGQTVRAAVTVTALSNVLVVPNSAVTRQGPRSFVPISGPGGQPVLTPFVPGAVGDDTTQVLSGLREGQQVLLPPATGAGS